jgi:hypothetical protein
MASAHPGAMVRCFLSSSDSDPLIGSIGRYCAEASFRDVKSRFRLLADLTG